MKRLLIILCLVLLASPAWSASYYVRYDGTVLAAAKANATGCASAATALSVAQHNAATFAAGDIINFCDDGGEIRAKVVPPTSGESGTPITYQAASGDSPILNGSQLLANASFTLTADQTNTYEISHTLGENLVAMIWEDDTRLTSRASIAEVESNAGSFYQAAATVYIHATDSSSVVTNGKVYEAPEQTENFDDNDKEYIILDGIECVKTYGATATTVGGIMFTGAYNIARNLTSHNHYRHCFTFYTGANDNIATNLILYDSPSTSLVAFYGADVTNNILDDCDISNVNDAAAGVVLHGAANANIIQNNRIGTQGFTGVGNQNAFILLTNAGTDNNIIRRNKLSGIHYDGITVTGVAGTKILFNIFDESSAVAYTIHLYGATSTLIYGNVIKNAAPNSHSLTLRNGAANIVAKNNIFDGDGGSFHVRVDAGCDTGLDINYNIFNGGAATPFQLATANKNFADWKTASSQDANSQAAVPLLDGSYYPQPSSPAINTGISPFANGDGDQYDFRGLKIWDDTTDAAVGAWADGVDIGAIARVVGVRALTGF